MMNSIPKDYLGNELHVKDKVIFICPNYTFRKGRVEYLYNGYDYIRVNFGGNFCNIDSKQCIKIRR